MREVRHERVAWELEQISNKSRSGLLFAVFSKERAELKKAQKQEEVNKAAAAAANNATDAMQVGVEAGASTPNRSIEQAENSTPLDAGRKECTQQEVIIREQKS